MGSKKSWWHSFLQCNQWCHHHHAHTCDQQDLKNSSHVKQVHEKINMELKFLMVFVSTFCFCTEQQQMKMRFKLSIVFAALKMGNRKLCSNSFFGLPSVVSPLQCKCRWPTAIEKCFTCQTFMRKCKCDWSCQQCLQLGKQKTENNLECMWQVTVDKNCFCRVQMC